MGAGKELHARTVKMSTLGVLAVVTVFYMIPSGLLSDIRDTQGLEGQLLAQGSSVLHHRQKRDWIWKQLFVQEEDPISRIIGQVKSDSDQGEFTIQYILSGEGAGDVFEMDEYSGEIRTLKKLDREEKAFYVLQAQAINRRTNEPAEPQSEFIIKVQDINDNAPQFLNEPYVSSIPEMSPVGTIVAQVTATDADDPMFGNNAKLIYSILQGEPYFSVQPKTGIIVTSWANMDREAREEYLVVVQVKDMLGLSGGYSSSTTVTISLSDVNDNGPTFQQYQYTFALPENSVIGTTVGRIMADDGDIGINARMTYRLEDDLRESSTFIIETHPETQEGVILLAKPLDYESKRLYAMEAEAVNEHPDTRFLTLDEFSDRTKLKIFVEDVDEPPVFFSALYQWKVPENAPVGTVVGTVSARDTDTVNNPIRYSIDKKTDATNTFKIDPNNGTIAIARSLDRETSDWHNMSVEAKEITQNHLSSSVVVFITVLDVNDNMPRLARDYQPYICEGTQAGELIQLLSAVDPDEAVEEHHFYYSMVPDESINPNFTIRDNQDNTAGILARRSTFTRKDRTEYLLPVVVADSGTPALSSTTTLTISVCSCLPAGHCPTGGVEALALSGVSMQTLIGVLVCLVMLTALSVLMLMVRRHRRKHQEGTDVEAKELELPFSQKNLHYGKVRSGEPAWTFASPSSHCALIRGGGRGGCAGRKSGPAYGCHSESHTSLGQRTRSSGSLSWTGWQKLIRILMSHRLIAFGLMLMRGSGSPSGSLSSLDSSSLEFESEKPVFNSKPYVIRLTPWYGGAEEDTIF